MPGSLLWAPPLILWLHQITVSHICIMCAYTHCRGEANRKLKTRQSPPEMWWAVLAQTCVSWPIKEDWTFGGGGGSLRNRSFNRAKIMNLKMSMILYVSLKLCTSLILWTWVLACIFSVFAMAILANVSYVVWECLIMCNQHLKEEALLIIYT